MTDQDNENNKLLAHQINVTNNAEQTSYFSDQHKTADKDAEKKKKCIKFAIIGGVIAAALILIISLSVTLPKKNDDKPAIFTRPLDPPGPVATPAIPAPPVYPTGYYNTYTVDPTTQTNTQDTASGFIVSDPYSPTLHDAAQQRLYQGISDTHSYGINGRSIQTGLNNQFITNVSYQFGMTSYHTAYLLMTDANNKRFSIPQEAVNSQGFNPTMRLEMLGFQLQASPFQFSFTDITDPTNVFLTTAESSVVFMDKYIQMDFQLPSQRIYGFGERVHEFGLGEGTWTMWAKGQDSPYDDGTGGHQVYGVHPFILVQGKNAGDFFGMFFRNANAQSPLIKYNADGSSTLSYITTGGQIELYIFMHGSAKSIIQMYHNVIGTPNLPPFWSFGWQQASWKYLNQQQVQDMINNYQSHDMPLETVYLDIPYLKNYADFSVDTATFPDLAGMANTLHANKQHLVVILDAGLSADDLTNPYYVQAQNLGILIQSFLYSDPAYKYKGAIVQHVWPQATVFLDWFHPQVTDVWYQGLHDLFQQVPYDGLWIDMNEATGFCDGECYVNPFEEQDLAIDTLINKLVEEEELEATPLLKADDDESWFYSYHYQREESTYYLPFIPGFNYAGNLDNMALSLNATHPSNGISEYNLHSTYGLMMAKHTHNFLLDSAHSANYAKRPFVLSRSTFSGSGRYTSHWLGDNWRDWNYLRYSIAGIMNMNMFGIPQVGADVCGFFGEKKDDDMCARWVQLSTFYPLARAHQNLTWKGGDSEYSEPYLLAEPYLSIARDSMYDRYAYLRHVYTCMFEVSQWGGTCFDPQFYYYPTDANLFTNIEDSFIVGGALKISPVLEAGKLTGDMLDVYFPQGTWVNMVDFTEVIDTSVTGGAVMPVKIRNTVITHLRDGALVAYQNRTNNQFKSTEDLLATPITLVANLDANGASSGTVLLDTGSDTAEIWDNQYEYLKFQVSSNMITKQFAAGTPGTQNHVLDKVVIVNAPQLVNTDFACIIDQNLLPTNLSYWFDDVTNALHIQTATYPATTLTFDSFKMIYYGSSSSDINLCNKHSYQYSLKSPATVAQIDLSKSTATFTLSNNAKYGVLQTSVLPDIKVMLQMVTPNIVNVNWTFVNQPSGQRIPFTTPTKIINPTIKNQGAALSNVVTLVQSSSFLITLNSLDGNSVMDINGMLYSSWMNVIKTRVYEKNEQSFTGIFGLGERTNPDLAFQDGVYSMYSRDTANEADDGTPPAGNSYGTHPFYMFRSDVQVWTGVYTNIPQAQDWIISNNPESGAVDVGVVAMGGIADIYVILGYDPKQVASDYWNFIVGKPVLPPVYALGWNQCKWGYATTQDLKDVVAGYINNNIPLDTQWSDIDYLQSYRDFTYDTDRYSDLPAFVTTLHNQNMHYVPIIDAGIALRKNQNYAAYDSGEAAGVFIKASSALTNQDFVGEVWPNEAVYPDWQNPNTANWYVSQLNSFQSKVAFDGLWLDMNEASNFCNGACQASQKVSNSVLSNLKYIPSNRNLEEKSIAVDAWHYGNVLEADMHSLFGTQEVIAANQYFTSNAKRPFIISRSSFAGMGKYGSKWLGDNFSNVQNLENSITGVMLMNLFGIPLAGADICGFIWDTTPELCARWTVIGAFYPFSRNHNNYGQAPQEPYQPWFANTEYEPGTTYMQIMRQGIRNKYHLIKYYYTQMFLGSQYGTGPFFNPMFFEFPEDPNVYSDITTNIMIGPALKLSANTNTLGKDTTQFYFPSGTWCNVYVPTQACITTTGGESGYKTMSTKAYDFYIHLFQGHIVPMQDATKLNIMNTAQLTAYPVDLHILGAQNKIGYSWYSTGAFVNDDGLTTVLSGYYNQYAFAAMASTGTPSTITFEVTHSKTATSVVQKNCNAVNQNDYLGTLYFYNANALGASMSLKVTVAFTQDTGLAPVTSTATYDATTDRLVLNNSLTPICMTSLASITFT